MGVVGSHGGHLFWVRNLKGAEGVTPPKISNFSLPKVAQTPYPQCKKIRNHVSYAKIRATSWGCTGPSSAQAGI